ncbi:MAG: V-type ATP synthase subunit A [Acidobacteria bacterium]|nr:V-type ATP synthase subunit A [Acidobacteriota bacterium]
MPLAPSLTSLNSVASLIIGAINASVNTARRIAFGTRRAFTSVWPDAAAGLRDARPGVPPAAGTAPALDCNRLWDFQPRVCAGDRVCGGDLLGVVQETPHLQHRILVPPLASGIVEKVEAGRLTVHRTAAVVREGERLHHLSLSQRWPARQPRPHAGKLEPVEPLVTGQRIIDSFFPIAKGGVAVVPGGFGTGKTVLEQTLARWADADIVVYVGCGERGNEMTEVLEEFPRLQDPRTGGALMDRTVLVANTSNMPVAAREASIYTAITIAEYFRDMGYDVALMADSTSRWGEALREISARLEEMPGEEGYPAYLLSRLGEFYGRAGRVRCSASRQRNGSVTLIGTVSPSGGDFSEPMTQNSLRVTGAFWGLDISLARRRHFPAIHWTSSYSLYALGEWFDRQVAPDWSAQVNRARALLQREKELQEIAQLIGAESLAETDKETLAAGRILREDFLQQSAYDQDAFCSPEKSYWMLKLALAFHDRAARALQHGFPLQRVLVPEITSGLACMKEWPASELPVRAGALLEQMDAAFAAMAAS